MLLSTYSDAEVSSLGDVYVRLFLPTITQQLLSDCKLLLSEPAYYDLVEEELKTFLILSASYSNEQMNYQVSNLTIMVFLQVAETMEGCITQNCLNISEIIGGTFLQLASKSQLIFRSVLQNLSDQQRQTLESGMKFFVNSKSQPNPYPSGGNTEEFDAPKIHLKKFGE